MILKLYNRLEAAQEIILMWSDYVNFKILLLKKTPRLGLYYFQHAAISLLALWVLSVVLSPDKLNDNNIQYLA